jgi:branched-chain amino acid transport system ATP-binding protein
MPDPMLEVSGLTMRFGGLTALDGLSLSVAPATIHAVIGPNGAGKSTFFNCISRFYQPSAGRIAVQGTDILRVGRAHIARMGVARTFQNLELFGQLSVIDNVRIGMHARSERQFALLPSRRRTAQETREIAEAEQILERVGLQGCRDKRASQLDFGAQKLLELARALAVRPRLLLLDEPAAGLRTSAIETIDRLLVDLVRREGMTIVLVEHVMSLVMAISHRITVLNFGRKIAEGDPAAIREDPAVIAAYLGGKRRHAGS